MDEKEAVRVLKKIKDILDREDVTYWLDCGTLLGAVREGKFISWDTDIDLRALETESKKIAKAIQKIEESIPVKIKVGKTKILCCTFDIEISLYTIKDSFAYENYIFSDVTYLVSILQSVRNLLLDNRKKQVQKAAKNFPINMVSILANIISSIPTKYRFKLAKILNDICEIYSKQSNVVVKIPKKYFDNLSTINFYGMEFSVPSPVEEYLEFRYGEDWRIPKKDYVYYRDDGAIVSKENTKK